MALDRDDQARLRRIQRGLAAEDPECDRRMRDYSALLDGNRRRAATEPTPWVGVLLIWALVLAAAITLIAATAGAP